jgi:7,8-dihydropterin-6-yl-methyl-4-(beta-D-ribofuranosyl)aminobenzene 5'-phosphate synthase
MRPGEHDPAFAATLSEAPIRLEPVDELTITILVDNATDIFPEGPTEVARALVGDLPRATARQYGEGEGLTGLRAEHGCSALVEVRRGTRRHTLLFDTGSSPDGIRANGERLGVDPTSIEPLVLNHGPLSADRCNTSVDYSNIVPRRWLRGAG